LLLPCLRLKKKCGGCTLKEEAQKKLPRRYVWCLRVLGVC